MGRPGRPPNPTNPPRLIGDDPRPDPQEAEAPTTPAAAAPIRIAVARTVPREPAAGSAIALAAASVEATVLESDRAMLARNREYLRAERSRLRVKIAGLAEKAMQTLSDLCDEGIENPVRLRAAETILDRVGVQMGRGSGGVDAADDAAADEGGRMEYGSLTPDGQRTLLRKAVAFLQAGQNSRCDAGQVVQIGPAPADGDTGERETPVKQGSPHAPQANGSGTQGADGGQEAPTDAAGGPELEADPGEGGGGG